MNERKLWNLYDFLVSRWNRQNSGSSFHDQKMKERIKVCMELVNYLLGESGVFVALPGFHFIIEKNPAELASQIQTKRIDGKTRNSMQPELRKKIDDVIALLDFLSGANVRFTRFGGVHID